MKSSVTGQLVCFFHVTRYGRYKFRQLLGERLTRRQRKYVWDAEHRRGRRATAGVS